MSEEEKRGEKKPRHTEDIQELKAVLGTVSEMVPSLIRGILGSVFSAEAGENMGRAAANFYKELKAAGIPDDVAVRMTEDYVKTFTDIGKLMREAVSGGFPFKQEKEIVEKEIRKEVSEKAAEKKEE